MQVFQNLDFHSKAQIVALANRYYRVSEVTSFLPSFIFEKMVARQQSPSSHSRQPFCVKTVEFRGRQQFNLHLSAWKLSLELPAALVPHVCLPVHRTATVGLHLPQVPTCYCYLSETGIFLFCCKCVVVRNTLTSAAFTIIAFVHTKGLRCNSELLHLAVQWTK